MRYFAKASSCISIHLFVLGGMLAYRGQAQFGPPFQDSQLQGTIIRPLLEGKTEEECKTACSKNPQCKGFSYRRGGGLCYLFAVVRTRGQVEPQPDLKGVNGWISFGKEATTTGTTTGACAHFAGTWRDGSDLEDMKITQNGCTLSGGFNNKSDNEALNGRFEHSFENAKAEGNVAIVQLKRIDSKYPNPKSGKIESCTVYLPTTLTLTPDGKLKFDLKLNEGQDDCGAHPDTRTWQHP